MKVSTLTDRGQVSVPASLRKKMRLHTGVKLRWVQVTDHECRVIVDDSKVKNPMAALGMAPKLRKSPARTTKDWMKELREGE